MDIFYEKYKKGNKIWEGCLSARDARVEYNIFDDGIGLQVCVLFKKTWKIFEDGSQCCKVIIVTIYSVLWLSISLPAPTIALRTCDPSLTLLCGLSEKKKILQETRLNPLLEIFGCRLVHDICTAQLWVLLDKHTVNSFKGHTNNISLFRGVLQPVCLRGLSK